MEEKLVTFLHFVVLCGLYGIYHSDNKERVRREAALTPIDDDFGSETFTDELNSELHDLVEHEEDKGDYEFLESMGWLEKPEDAPKMFAEDIQIFQANPFGNSKKAIPLVTKCMGSESCRKRAKSVFRSWGQNSKKFIENYRTMYMKPIATSILHDPLNRNNFGGCSNKDNIWTCTNRNDRYQKQVNEDPTETITMDADILNALEKRNSEKSKFRSSNLNETLEYLKVDKPNSKGNVFSKAEGAVKVILIVPNGQSISMGEGNFNNDYPKYYQFFKDFNDRYIGISKTKTFKNRNGFEFWFLRQDKDVKALTKSPVKAGKRFPWARFNNLLAKPANSATQPKLLNTYKLLFNAVHDKKIMLGSDRDEGRDCIIFWFHQYLPQDLVEMADSVNQEIYIGGLESTCTIFHFWVGFEAIADGGKNLQVVKYLQGLFQPGQVQKTASDSDLRRWFYVNNMDSLDSGNNLLLMETVYNTIALERRRTTCLFSAGGVNVPELLEQFRLEALDGGQAEKEAAYNYYDYEALGGAYTTTTVVSAFPSTTAWDNNLGDLAFGEEYFESYTTMEPISTAAPVLLPPDYACCGIGFSGERYDTNIKQCCPEGVKPLGEECLAL